MKTKSNNNQKSGLLSRPEQLGTATQDNSATLPLWCIGYADREFAKIQNDPVLATVRAATKEEAEAKAREMGIDDKCAGLWAWPQPKQTEQLPPLDFNKRRTNRQLPTEAVVSLLRTNASDFFALAEVVGKWIWVRFADKQPPTITRQLAELGFHWNNKRQVWQHPCGHLTQGSPNDPRSRYGSYYPAETKTV